VGTDPLFAPWRQLAEEEGFRSFISVPLVVGADAIGTLNQYLAEPHEFSAAEINMLTGVCRLVCVAIERAHLYEALKKQHETAQQVSEKKSRFLAAVSHELRAPMTAIVGFTDLLLKQIPGPLNDDQRRQLRLLASSAQHLLLLIADVLDVSKIEAGRMECVLARVDTARVVGEALDMMGPLAEAKGLTLEWQPPAPPIALSCDAQRCKQVLVNLLSNAIKFTTRGRIRVEARRAARQARISVSDTGIGVKTEDLPLLFEEFQQVGTPLASVFRGSGLGLSLSRELARLMGGDIEVQSVFGQGSTFTLVLEALG
jgi:signal transduction histidine kinase